VDQEPSASRATKHGTIYIYRKKDLKKKEEL
jgi:hypothetical protein